MSDLSEERGRERRAARGTAGDHSVGRQEKPGAARIDSLTSLRFFAASAIVLHHIVGEIWLPAGSVPHFALSQQVSLFFVLSGFILHLNYRDDIAGIPFHKFFLLRAARLWPAHLFALGFVLVLFAPWALPWIRQNHSTLDIARVVFLLHAWTTDIKVAFAINSPSWSISVELFFYALFPVLSVLVRRRGIPVLVAMAVVTAVYLGLSQVAVSRGWANATALAYWSPPARLLEFVAGIVACEIMLRRPRQDRSSRGLAIGTAWEVLALALVLAAQLGSLPLSRAIAAPFGGVWAEYMAAAGPFPAFALLIAVLYRQQGLVSRALEAPWLVRLGDWSFALYLLHQPMIRWMKEYVPQSTALAPGQFVVFAATLLGLSAFVFYCVERPGLRLAKRLLFRSPRDGMERGARTPA